MLSLHGTPPVPLFRYLANAFSNHAGRAVLATVGWVERSEPHHEFAHRAQSMIGFAALNHSSEYVRRTNRGESGSKNRVKPPAAHHAMYWPPLAVSVEPVMRPASSEARNRTQRATSSGSPRRPIGMSGRTDFSSTSFDIALTMSVLM